MWVRCSMMSCLTIFVREFSFKFGCELLNHVGPANRPLDREAGEGFVYQGGVIKILDDALQVCL